MVKAKITLLSFLLSFSAYSSSFESTVKPFLEKYCYECHGQDKQKARIRYDKISAFNEKDHALWTLVYEQLNSADMPPRKSPQPTAEEKAQLLSWIEKQSENTLSSSGSGYLRRLNRRELSSALQNVSGLKVDYTKALPEDGKVNGFDTGVGGLQDAADSVAQILDVSRQTVEGIYFKNAPETQSFHADLSSFKDPAKDIYEWRKQGIYMKRPRESVKGLGLLIEPKWLGDRTNSFNINIPVPEDKKGLVRIRFSLSKLDSKFKNLPNPHLWFSVGGQKLKYEEISNSPDQPRHFEFHIDLAQTAVESRGLSVKINNRVEVPYFVDGFENEDRSKGKVEGGTGPWRPKMDKKLKGRERPAPYLVLHDIKIDVNWKRKWSDETLQENDTEAARKLIHKFLEKAWRKKVHLDKVEHFLNFYASLRSQGKSFDQAVRASFHSILMSAPFRYMASPFTGNESEAHYAIASRLSFMFTGGPPDEMLLNLAENKKLRDPQIISEQVDRLLISSESRAFFDPFVKQWLEMNQPITQAMDFFEKQDFRFGRFLKSSMRSETVEYVRTLFTENRPAGELVSSDWTMMNNILAYHYDYKGIDGAHLRKVKLRTDDPKGGGILSHAGIQSMLCWMGENWVIYRGTWALKHILDDPPPAPPLEVPELDPSSGKNKGKTPRQLLKQHQEDENCSVCHVKIDPLGFAFQNFDLSGRWRDLEYEKYQRKELDGKLSWKGTGKSRPVDAAGNLPRGEEFKDFTHFKKLLVEHYIDDITRGLMKNLTLYSTGRKAFVTEVKEINKMMSILKKQNYPMRDLMKAVLTSRSFLGKKVR